MSMKKKHSSIQTYKKEKQQQQQQRCSFIHIQKKRGKCNKENCSLNGLAPYLHRLIISVFVYLNSTQHDLILPLILF